MVSVNAIQGTLIADNAITAVHIATNAVSGTLIADNAVTATHIAQNTITVTQLADDCVESDKIADGVITTNHLNKAMISSQTEVTAATGDFVLLGDTSDSNNLKKTPLSSVVALASSFDADAAQTFNDSGAAVDFRVEGDTDQNLFFIDGSADAVGIGTNDPKNGYGGAITAAKLALLSGVSGNNGGSSTLLIGGDNKHYAYMQGTHTSGGSTQLDLGTANGANNPTVKVSILPTGGITFNGDTAAANALDDYEEGTWTPAFYTSGGVTTTTTTTNYGIYTKIGRMVYIHAKLHVTLSSLPGQIVTVTGLPFTGETATVDTGQRAIFAIGGDASNLGGNAGGSRTAHFRLNNDQLQGVYMNSGTTAYWYYNHMDSTTFDMNIHGHYAAQ